MEDVYYLEEIYFEFYFYSNKQAYCLACNVFFNFMALNNITFSFKNFIIVYSPPLYCNFCFSYKLIYFKMIVMGKETKK